MKSSNKYFPEKKSEITGTRRGWMGWALRPEQKLTFLREAVGFSLADSLFPRGLPWERLPSAVVRLVSIGNVSLSESRKLPKFCMRSSRG